MSKARKSVWIVEASYAEQREWHPTVGVALDRQAARAELKQWRSGNPNDKFRLAKYQRKEA